MTSSLKLTLLKKATNANTDVEATSNDFFPKADVVEEGATNANTDVEATSNDFFPKADVVEEGLLTLTLM